MIRLRVFACAALALLALSSSGCRRRHPKYVEQPPAGPPGAPPPDGPPGAPPDGPPAPPPPMPHSRANRPPPPAGTNRALTVTGAAQSLTRLTHEPVDELTPSLSPSGAVVLFETRVSAEGKVTQQAIVGVDPRSGGARTGYTSPGTRSGAPAWLPDGGYVFVSDASGRPALVRSLAAAPNAATATILGPDAVPEVAHPSPSPDGKRIAFEASLKGKTQIAVAHLDGSRLTPLGEGARPSWSPDGKRIVFTRTVLDYSQIFVINPDGSGVAQVTSDAADHDDPAWAPSSKLLVFNSNKGFDRQGGSWNLFVVKIDGTGQLQLTEGNSDTGAPSWGNDGWIYFDSNQAGSYDIWRMRPAGEIDALGNRR